MYDLARGPLVWVAFGVFIIGGLYRLLTMIIRSKKDKVVYPYWNTRFGLRSLIHWIIPFGSVNMRKRPAFTIISYLFHICLLVTPVFTLGHVLLWEESWGVSWWTLPDSISDVMTITVVSSGVVFFLRRIADPTVRYVTSFGDFIVLVIVLLPFITGLIAHNQIGPYKTMITIHMLSGELWLMVIPFTRLVHMLFFPFTRAYMGSEFGYVRHARDW